jgi:TonB family protein
MIHGVEFYFHELRSSGRRIVLGTLVLHVLAVAAILATQIPAVRSRLKPPDRPIVRFGYEGADRFVERVILASQSGYRAPLVDIGKVDVRPTRRGGAGLTPADRAERSRPSRNSTAPGPGDDEITLVAEARARMASVPLVQSSELVIESMVEPDYPDRLHAQGIEGRVAIMALIDTSGQVADLSVVAGSGYDEFEESAMSAVRQARFRPYRTAGVTQEVYALIRYRFRIY